MRHTDHNKLHLFTVAIVTTVIVVGDWIAKNWALTQLGDRRIPVFPGMVDILLHRNEGVVSNIPIPLAVVLPLTVLILIGCAYWLWKSWDSNHRLALSLVVLIGGAIGNFADRLINNFTTDYLLLFSRSVINLADVLIVIGVIGILFTTKNTSLVKK